MLCTVTQVEETKQMIKMIPILILTIIPSTMVMQTFTLFIKQGTTLDRRMGPHFEIPPASLTAFIVIFILISLVVYDCSFVPVIRSYTKNPRGITLLQRIGVGLVFHVLVMVIACLVERKRLSVARENNLLGPHDTLPLTIFILFPQFALAGVADSFVETAKMEFFYDQAPQGMKSLGAAFSTTSLGLGGFASAYILSTVADITRRHGHEGWILNNLNISHLDYYYASMVVLCLLNLICFVVVAKFYVYNDVRQNKPSSKMNSTPSQDNSTISQSNPQEIAKS
jgi:peptide/histidine transporter 3/4